MLLPAWLPITCSKHPTTVPLLSSLQKGAGYHLDLFLVAVLMIICSFMGLPWYVAATVISIAHIDSLKMETETSAPGEQPKFLGVRYASRAGPDIGQPEKSGTLQGAGPII